MGPVPGERPHEGRPAPGGAAAPAADRATGARVLINRADLEDLLGEFGAGGPVVIGQALRQRLPLDRPLGPDVPPIAPTSRYK